ncbi:MAG: hypothetical protein HYT10_02850 [Candidatus Levybacteria bacterium]|nr:hypothetical protein [Candidatus Levybacteria bacterium]
MDITPESLIQQIYKTTSLTVEEKIRLVKKLPEFTSEQIKALTQILQKEKARLDYIKEFYD